MVLQNKIVISIYTLNKIKSTRVHQNKIITSIHCNLFIHEIWVSRCVIYIHCNLFILIYIYYNLFIHLHTLKSIKRRFLGGLTSVWRRRRLPCTCGRAAVMVKEEEAGSSDVDGSGGDRHEQHRRRRRREQQSRESSGDLESFGMK
jgi:hypothetical protein